MNTSTTGIKPRQTYSISDLCEEFGVTPRTLRFYEQRKLLAPSRTEQARVFSYRDRGRLQLILLGKQYGFTLSEIKEMLDLYEPEGGNSKQLKAVLPKLQAQLKHLQSEQADLDRTICQLQRSCEQIAEELNQ